MRSAPPSRKASASASKSHARPAPPPPPPSSPPAADDLDDDGSSSEDDDFVSEDSMARLLEALGPDGVKEALAELQGAIGSDGDEDDEDDDDDGEFEDQEGELSEDDVGEIPLAELADLSAPEESDDDEEAEEDEGDMDMEDAEEKALDELDDEDDEVDEDAVPYQKVTIYNKHALNALRQRIHAPYVGLRWSETMDITAPGGEANPMAGVDATDDLTREVAFYKQALDAANLARTLAAKDDLPFTRPSDYYAEMVKSDAHMERVRQRLLDESSGIKKSEDARKQRDLKKFGKKVQTAKLQEREGERRAMDDRLKTLKRKRKDGDGALGGDGEFDVKLEEAITSRPGKVSNRGGAEGGRGGSKMTRQGRDKKFGFGSGGGRFSKSNTRESTEDMSDFNGGRGGRGRGGGRGGRGGARGGGAQREGKSKRMHSRRK